MFSSYAIPVISSSWIYFWFLDFLWCKFWCRFHRNRTAVALVALFWSHFWDFFEYDLPKTNVQILWHPRDFTILKIYFRFLDFLWCKFCYRFLRNQTAVARVALFWSHFWVEMQVLKSRTDSDAILTIFSSWIYFRFLDFFVMQILAQVSSKSDCCSPSSAVQKSFLRLFWV